MLNPSIDLDLGLKASKFGVRIIELLFQLLYVSMPKKCTTEHLPNFQEFQSMSYLSTIVSNLKII